MRLEKGARSGALVWSFLFLAGVLRAQVVPNIEIAESLLVELDAAHPSAGELIWENHAPDTMGDFEAVGAPFVEIVDGVTAVTFINSTLTLDAYQSIEPAPGGLIGLDPTRSIEAWVYNPQIASEETIVAWGRRGGPNGTNMSFNYGTHGLFGAVGHWGGDGPDLGWNDDGGAPAAGRWHHLVYTYDGTTTRVYADGELANMEELGPGVIDTFGPSRITLAAQLEPDGVGLNFPLRGTLSIARLRIHDGVLTPAQVRRNFDLECPEFCPPPGLCACRNCPLAGDFHYRGKATYTRQLDFDAVPPPTALAVVGPAGATLSPAGLFSYTLPVPPPASFQVTLRCTNPQGNASFTWTVTLVDPPPRGNIEIAGELFVDLDALHPSAGESVWLNAGTLADFGRVGNPLAGVLGPEDSAAVSFNEGAQLDAYQCLEDAPAGLIGPDPTRTIEAWVFNPDIASEETILAWGRRGGPNGTNMSFNYGTHALFGAVGHWGGDGPDLGWDNAGGAPPPGEWHHLVYTYDGGATNTTRVYADGLLANSELLGPGVINTFGPSRITLAAQLEPDGRTLNFPLRGTLAFGQVRIHDEVLTPSQVFHNFMEERERYGVPDPGVQPPLFLNTPAKAAFCAADDTYTFRLDAFGIPPPTLSVVRPAGATISGNGLLRVLIPSPPPASFEVEVLATNSAGDERAIWTVRREDVSKQLQVAGDLFVDLDANHETAGTAEWFNAGDLDDFIAFGNPTLVTREGARGVSFNEGGRSGDAYESQEFAPEGLVGLDPTRTIEAWVYNPDIAAEETILAWGRRGGPNGTNMSFNYGTHALFGAVGHWGGDGPDLGWNNAGGAPAANQWHHLVYTYDGTTTRVYADGELANMEELGAGVINTHIDTKIVVAAQLELDGITRNVPLQGTLTIGKVRIHDEVLSPCQILSNYRIELPQYRVPCPEPGDPEHGDTHCTGLEVIETGLAFGPTHRAIATAVDDSGDQIYYTFTADNRIDPPIVIGPVTINEVGFVLRGRKGPFTFSVTVTDRPECNDRAADATCVWPPVTGVRFVRGDADADGTLSLTDAVRVLNFLFTGGLEPPCMDAADADDSGVLSITDAIRILGWLFTGGLPPPAPSPSAPSYSPGDCGLDPTEDALGCNTPAVKCR